MSEKDTCSNKEVHADNACFQRGDYCLFDCNIVTVECIIQSQSECEYAVRPLNGKPFLVSGSQLSAMRDFRVNSKVKVITKKIPLKKLVKCMTRGVRGEGFVRYCVRGNMR